MNIVHADGRVVPRNVPGELCTRGYSVMLGYWENPEATAQAIDAGRYMHTGDIATMDDDGYLNISGRIKDMVIRGGENVYPREIEEFHATDCTAPVGSEIGLQLELKGPLEMKDALVSGGDVQGTSQTRVAGQLMSLTTSNPDSSGGTANCTWNLPGYPSAIVAGYAVSAASAAASPLRSSALNAPGVAFYCTTAVPPGQVGVVCKNVGGDGASLSAIAQYSAKMPSHTLSATYGQIAANTLYYASGGTSCSAQASDIYLHYGDGCNAPAIAWNHSVTADGNEAGKISAFQLRKFSVTQPPAQSTSMPAYCADGPIPYDQYQTSVPAGKSATWSDINGKPPTDSPAFDIQGDSVFATSDSFDDSFMYMPNSSPAGPSIWVTLVHLSWSWTASWSQPTPAPSQSPPPAQLAAEVVRPSSGDGTTTLPTWQCALSNQ